MICIVCEERATGALVCRKHWFALPLEMRKRYWRETNFGESDPPEQWLADAVAAIEESREAT